MIHHPKNRADRRAINAKKKRRPEMQVLKVSSDNINSFVETGLKSMRLMDDSEFVSGVEEAVYLKDNELPHYQVTIKKEVPETLN